MKRFAWELPVLVVLISFLFVGCSNSKPQSATLIVTTNIPSAATPQILLFGPDGFFYQSANEEKIELQSLKPGIYKLIAFGLVDNSVIYIPQYSSVLIQLVEGKTTILNLVYKESGTAFVNPISNLKVLNAADIIDVQADYIDLVPNYPTSDLSLGQVIAAGPLAIYENGFLREIIGVSKYSYAVRLQTRDVDFAYVFPDAEIEIGKEVSDYEIAAALAIYDTSAQAFDLSKVYAAFSKSNGNVNAATTTKDLPVIGPSSYRLTTIASGDSSSMINFEKQFCASEALNPDIKEAVYTVGLDPCVYTEGKFYVSTFIATNSGVPTAVSAYVIASWSNPMWFSEEPYDGPTFGFKIKTMSYKSSYNGEISLPAIPITTVPIVAGTVPITISASLQPKVQAGLSVSGQGASVLEDGLTLVDYFTRLKGTFYAAGDSLSDDATRLDPSLKIINNLYFEEPTYNFLVDVNGNKLNSFLIAGDLRSQLELQLGVYDSPMRNVGGYVFVGFGTQLGVSLDVLCATDPWWSLDFEPYIVGGISLEALRNDYGVASKSYTLASMKYAAEPVVTIDPDTLSLAKGELWRGFLRLNGPSYCVGRELSVSFDGNSPLELLGYTETTVSLPESDWLDYGDDFFSKALDDAYEGSYTAILRVTGDRGDWLAPFTREIPIDVTIEPYGGFYVDLLPSEITASAGSYTTSNLYITTNDGFRGEVDLSLRGADGELIDGVSLLPSQVEVTDNINNFNANFIISNDMPSGTLEFYIWATSIFNNKLITKVTPITLHIE